MQGFQMIMNFLVMPLYFLSGAMFPLATAPQWMRMLMTVDPLTYGVAALRGVVWREAGVVPGPGDLSLALNVAVLALTAWVADVRGGVAVQPGGLRSGLCGKRPYFSAPHREGRSRYNRSRGPSRLAGAPVPWRFWRNRAITRHEGE